MYKKSMHLFVEHYEMEEVMLLNKKERSKTKL